MLDAVLAHVYQWLTHLCGIHFWYLLPDHRGLLVLVVVDFQVYKET